jgi:hypothetical protein
MLSGTAFDFRGTPHGSMGADFADYDNDGRLDLFVTSYGNEMATLYQNLGDGFFEDRTRQVGTGSPTMPHVTWGHGFVDFNNDGYRDLFIACGDLDDNVQQRDDRTAYMLPNILLMNTGQGRFVDASATSGEGMRVKRSSRGTAFGDLDNDGDIDVVVLNSRQEPTVLCNQTPGTNHWLQLRLCGTRTNRDGVGARVRVTAGQLNQVAEVHSGRSYQSHYGSRLHFGLGSQARVDRIEIRWLGGQTQILENIDADQIIVITEGNSSPRVLP